MLTGGLEEDDFLAMPKGKKLVAILKKAKILRS
jgi:hypothetical protein